MRKERCESGLPDCGEVVTSDNEGVPVCRRCADELLAEARAERTPRTEFKWVPEAPGHPGLYANLSDQWQPHKSLGAPLQPSTYDVYQARQFSTREECQAWCEANPSPVFVPVEHGFG